MHWETRERWPFRREKAEAVALFSSLSFKTKNLRFGIHRRSITFATGIDPIDRRGRGAFIFIGATGRLARWEKPQRNAATGTLRSSTRQIPRQRTSRRVLEIPNSPRHKHARSARYRYACERSMQIAAVESRRKSNATPGEYQRWFIACVFRTLSQQRRRVPRIVRCFVRRITAKMHCYSALVPIVF